VSSEENVRVLCTAARMDRQRRYVQLLRQELPHPVVRLWWGGVGQLRRARPEAHTPIFGRRSRTRLPRRRLKLLLVF